MAVMVIEFKGPDVINIYNIVFHRIMVLAKPWYTDVKAIKKNSAK